MKIRGEPRVLVSLKCLVVLFIVGVSNSGDFPSHSVKLSFTRDVTKLTSSVVWRVWQKINTRR